MKAVRIKVKLVFILETYASEATIGATLIEEGRQVSFFSRTLNPVDGKHCSIEKEAYAIADAVKK